jgi:hypothetical protein
VDQLTQTFEERLQETETYLDFLEALEKQLNRGTPKIGGVAITAQRQKILYAGVYLQLYNLVEATITWCVEAVCRATTYNERWLPSHLSVQLRREWVRSIAHTHDDLNYENRLKHAIEFCDRLVQALPVHKWKIDKRHGANWDESQIFQITVRLGLQLRVSPEVDEGVKRAFRDEKGPLVLVKEFRNRLAHGSLSFAECGEGVTVHDLRELMQRIAPYLREVVAAFKGFIDGYEFLLPEFRPVAGGLE